MPVWRRDAQGRPFSLVISNAGRKAIGVADADGREPRPRFEIRLDRPRAKLPSVIGAKELRRRKTSASQDRGQIRRSACASSAPSACAGTKKALLIEMLSGPAGASIDALMGATGWLPHTTRAALTGLRHAGYSIERFKRDDGVSVYRLLCALERQGKRVNVSSDRHDAKVDRA